MAKKIQIDVISDTVCPFCYLGKRRIESAIRTFQGQSGTQHVDFQVNWHPFQLNPAAPQEGINKRKFYEEKFGQRAPTIIENMKENFAAEGLAAYNIDGLTGNTLNSHRLIAHAGKLGAEKQNLLVEQLFKAYFTEAKFINDRSVLLEAAKSAGITDADKVLEDDSLEEKEVVAEIKHARRFVSGVPHFTFNQQYSISGAQQPDTFLSVFEQLSSAQAE